MMISPGHAPDPISHTRCCASFQFRAFGIFTVLLLTPLAAAEQLLPLTLQEAEELALIDEPGRSSYLHRAEALRDQSVAGGQLPDPTLRVGLANFPIQAGGFTTEGMTQAQMAIRQSFPGGDTRALTTQKYRSLANEMSHKAAGRTRDVLTAVRVAWLEAHYWRDAHRIVLESRPYFDDLVTITRSLYSVGRKSQQDVLRAELELRRLDDRVIEMNRQHERARAALAQWISAESSRPIAAALPEWNAIPPLEALRAGLANHPALMAAEASVGASAIAVDIAKQDYKPDWALDLSYGYRDGFLSNGRPRSDFVSLSVTFDLPFFGDKRQDRSVGAALSQRRAADQSREELRRRLLSRLESEFVHWQDLGRRLDLYDESILDLSADNATAALAAYRSDTGDFADAMRSFVDDLDTRIDYMRLRVERAQSYAVLANLGGFPR